MKTLIIVTANYIAIEILKSGTMKIKLLLKVAIEASNLIFHVKSIQLYVPNPKAVLCDLIFNLIIYVDLKKIDFCLPRTNSHT